MTDQAPAPKETKPWWPKIAAATPPVLIFLGCCYLEGYWGSFNVRFLDYITFNEVTTRSFLDVVPVSVFLIEIVVAMLFITRIKSAPGWLQRWADRQKAKPKNRAQQWVEANPVGFSLIINGVIFVYGVGAMVAAFVQELFFGGLLFGGGVCVAAAGGFLLERLWPKVIPNCSGAPICLFICLTPFFCYLRGRAHADHYQKGIILGEARIEPEFERKAEILELPGDHKYVGRMGGFVFFSSEKYQHTVAVPERKLDYIRIRVPKAPDRADGTPRVSKGN